MKRLAVLLFAIGALLGGTRPSEASPLTINIGSFSGGTAVIHAPGTLANNLNVLLGAVDITGDLGSFESYCVDLQHYEVLGANELTLDTMNNWNNYAVPARASSGGGAASWLYDTYAAGATNDKTKEAALSLAIWNSLYDNDFSVLGGAGFWVTSLSSATYGTLANTYLGALQTYLASGDPLPNNYWLRTTDKAGNYSQDFIGPRAVPEPASLLLFGAGLALTARQLRRRGRA